MKKQQLDNLVDGYANISTEISSEITSKENKTQQFRDPQFAVLKERKHIFFRLKKMAENSNERLVILLGQYGILHLCRNPSALEAVNEAALRGVVIQIMTNLDGRTIKFFKELHEAIEVRHSDELESLGFVRDSYEIVQYLSIEDNPVGRGKDDSALIIESQEFAESHMNLIDTIWESAIPFEMAVARHTDNQINDPLRLTIGEGSFLKTISSALGIETGLTEEDIPFDPDAFFAASKEVNEARELLTEGKLSNLKILGIDLGLMLRQIGNRVGKEISFSLRGIEHDIEFLEEMMDWWESAGLGSLEYEVEPVFHVKVRLNHPPLDDLDALPMWEMDDGIIEGALANRFAKDAQVVIQRVEASGDNNELWHYYVHKQIDDNVELSD